MNELEYPPAHTRGYISFSQMTVYDQCSYKHELEYRYGLRSGDTVHTVFGTAVHDAIDKTLRCKSGDHRAEMARKICTWIHENPYDEWASDRDDKGKILKMDGVKWARSAYSIYDSIFDWLIERFGEDAEVFGSEIRLFEPTKVGLKFKGFIDLVIRDEKGNYHLIDFKTTSKDWNRFKRQDTKKKYQLRLYKKYFCQKYNIDSKRVKVYFMLLKRWPGKDRQRRQKSHFELISVSSGKVAQRNASEWVEKQAKGIKNNVVFRNKAACTFCQFSGTEYCPGPLLLSIRRKNGKKITN